MLNNTNKKQIVVGLLFIFTEHLKLNQMKKYTFTVILTGYGDNADQAWRDAVESTYLDEDPTPEEFEVEDDGDYEDESEDN